MDERQWFGLVYLVLGLGLALTSSWGRVPRRIRLIAGMAGILLGLALLADDLLRVELVPGTWGMSASGLLGWSLSEVWGVRKGPKPA